MVRLLAPVRIRGTFGKALQFDGVDDYVEVPDSASLDITDEITIEFWIYPLSKPGYSWIIGKGGGWNRPGWCIQYNKGYIVIYVGDGTNEVNNWALDAVPTNKWTHYAVTFNKEEGLFRPYINGEPTGHNVEWDYIRTNDIDLFIGMADKNTLHFNGTIDEVRIYNRALSAEEIIQLFRGGHVWKGLVLWLRFDEGSGTTAGDSSGCGNHGTIYGATWTNGAMILRKPVR